MFEFFTEKAIKTMLLAQEECKRLKIDYMGVEHLQLGLILEGSGYAALALKAQSVTAGKLRQEIEKITEYGDKTIDAGAEIAFTPRAKRVLELAWDEARVLGHNYIGTEHLMLGILREGDSAATRALRELDVDLDELRKKVNRLIERKRT